MIHKTVSAAIAYLLLQITTAQAFAPVPPGDMTCAESPFPNDNYTYIKCEFPPFISKYVSPLASVPQRASILIDKHPSKKMALKVLTSGWEARAAYCDGWDGATENTIVMRHCHDHLPAASDYQYPMSWGGAFAGANPLGWRMAAVMEYVTRKYASKIDSAAGVTLEGFSYGGQTASLQAMIIEDVWAKALITKVNAGGYGTLFFRQDNPVGLYWRDAGVKEAWGGYDWTRADFRTKAGKLVYHRITGASNDTLVNFDIDVFRYCDSQRVACFGLWHNGGHGAFPSDLNLPSNAMFSGSDSDARLDKPLPIFTESTANHWGAVGHYNLGLEWNAAGIVDTRSLVSVPIRYRRHIGIGYGVPDQPTEAAITVTLRRTKLNPVSGEQLSYRLGATSGVVAVISTGEVTIPALTLASSTTYTTLEIWR